MSFLAGARKKIVAAAVAASLLTATGCGQFSGIYDIPLPGGADLGENPYTVTIHFADVLDLVPQAGVQVNNVPVGRVQAIGLAPDGWTAEVTVQVNGGVRLPANTLANVKQTSLLGEKYVQLEAPPPEQARGTLSDGALIPLERTDRGVEVEEVLGALSMLLNGGGVEQLNVITKELNNALEGNEPNIKALLNNAEQLVTNLDNQSSNITRALDGLNRLSSTLNAQREQIGNAIDSLGPGLQVLEAQRDQFVTMLQALRDLSGIAIDTVNASKEDIVANLQALLPTLRKLGEAGADLPKALELLLTFPFADSAVPAVKGDYFNLFADVQLDLREILANLGRSRQNPLKDVPGLGDLVTGRQGQTPGAPPPLPLPQQAPQQGQPQQGQGGGVPPMPQQTGPGGIFSVLNGGAG